MSDSPKNNNGLDPEEIYIENDQELCEDCLKELHLKEEKEQ